MKMKIATLAAVSAMTAVAALSQAQASGFGTYFAGLSSAGAVAFSSGVASAAKTAVGKYEITFNRPIANCAFLANVNGIVPGYAITRKKPGTDDVLQVITYNATGALTDFNFTTFVVCNS